MWVTIIWVEQTFSAGMLRKKSNSQIVLQDKSKTLSTTKSTVNVIFSNSQWRKYKNYMH